jgi:hypothetical protein
VMASVREFLTERLKLKVNEAKSALERPWKRKFLAACRREQPEWACTDWQPA